MRLRRFVFAAVAAALASSPILAQTPSPNQNGNQGQRLSPERQADTEALLALIKTTPLLPMERVEVKISPPMTLGLVSAVTADKMGNIYVVHRPEDPQVDPILVLDSTGKVIRSWGKGMYKIPHSIRIDSAGNVWTVDAHTSVVDKFTAQGKKLLEFSIGDIPDASRPFCGATDVTFNKNGHIYVSDGYCNARFLEYTADGKKVGEWGKKGTGAGEFNLPHDVSISPDGILYVADRENGRLQWFDQQGKYLGEKKFGGQLFSVAVSAMGDVYVGTQARGVPLGTDANIFKFDPKSGKVIGRVEALAHQLGVAPDGTLLPGTGPIKIGADMTTTSVLLFRPHK